MNTDMKMLRQSILNLLNNAGKYTHYGKVQFTAKKEQREGKTWHIFEVSDSGIGIKGENFDRLFDPFIQEPVTNPELLQGCGLGLAITKHYCSLLNGHCEAKSIPGKGSTFTLAFPSSPT